MAGVIIERSLTSVHMDDYGNRGGDQCMSYEELAAGDLYGWPIAFFKVFDDPDDPGLNGRVFFFDWIGLAFCVVAWAFLMSVSLLPRAALLALRKRLAERREDETRSET